MPRNAHIIGRQVLKDSFLYFLNDEKSRQHSVIIPQRLLSIPPADFPRGSDDEHLETIACGAVLMRIDEEETYHRVFETAIPRAYRAAKSEIVNA